MEPTDLSPAFSPLQIGPLTLRNRLIKSATNEGMTPNGVPSRALVRFHERIAEGGAALTTVAYCAISDDGRTFVDQARLDVPTVRLDDVLPETVDFIKIDAEGGEREIWRGMSKTIANNPQLQIFLEFNPKRTSNYDPQEFLDAIEDDGFELAVIGYDASTRAVDGARLVANGTEQILHLRRAAAA